ncbi:hypothetical protein ACI19R_003644 [Escherichia coli]
MKLSKHHRQIIDYLGRHEAITARQAAEQLYGSNVSRFQVDAARRSIKALVSKGVIEQDGNQYRLIDTPEIMVMRDKIMWLFTEDGQKYLMKEAPRSAAASLTVAEIGYVFYCLSGRDDDLEWPYSYLWHIVQTMLEDGLLVAIETHAKCTCEGKYCNFSRSQRYVEYAPPDFKPTPEQVQAAKEAADRKFDEAIKSMFRAFHPGLNI